MPSNITPQRVPLVDTQTGIVSREWYNFFLTLFNLTGAGGNDVSLTDLQVGPPVLPATTASKSVCPQLRVYRSTPLSFSSVGNQQVIMNLAEVDTAFEYDTVAGLWTPSKTGNYAISAGVGFSTVQPAGSQLELKIYKGTLAAGSRRQYFYYNVLGGAVAPQINGADTIFPVTAGDTYCVVVSVAVNPTSILASRDATWFSAAYQPPTY